MGYLRTTLTSSSPPPTGEGFNGGRSQTNVNTLNVAEFPFMNVMKSSGAWGIIGANEVYTPDKLDAQGYPNVFFSNGPRVSMRVPTQTQRPGNYIVTWDGTGTVSTIGDILTGNATFTGSISGTTLTISGLSGTIKMGQRVTGGTTLPYTFIVSGSGTTYTVSKSQTATGITGATVGSFTSSGAAGAGFCVIAGPGDTLSGFANVADLHFIINAIGSPWITNVKIYHVDDAADIEAGKVFGKKFMERLREANFGVIRFLNWVPSNGSNVTTWATRKPADYFAYEAYQYKLALYCTTPATRTGTAYTATPPSGFTLADKATIHLKWGDSYTATTVTFTNASTSIAMAAHGLSVGDRLHFTIEVDPVGGAVLPGGFAQNTIYYVKTVPDAGHITVATTPGGTAIAASGTGTAGAVFGGNPFITLNLGAGPVDILGDWANWFRGSMYPIGSHWSSLQTLVYDASLQAWIRYGMPGGNAPGSVGIDNGVPIEVCIQLCVELGAHPYFCAPAHALDPMTDYIPMLAQYCKDNCPAWMIPRFEGPNELWNDKFHQTGYAVSKSTAYKLLDPTHWNGGDFSEWYGKIMSTLGQAVSVVYGNDRSKYQVIIGVHTAYLNPGASIELDRRFTSASYVNQTIAVQPPLTGSFGTITFTKSSAASWANRMCCAQYFTPGLIYTTPAHGTPNEQALATTYAGGGAPAAAALTQYVNSCASFPVYGVFDATIPKQLVNAQEGKALCIRHGVEGMTGYEGCYSPDYSGTDPIATMRRAAKWEPALYTHTLQNLNNFVSQTGGGFIAEFPSNFIMGAQYTWAILDPDIYTTSKQWDAHVAFNHP